jgi:hypothetical protein
MVGWSERHLKRNKKSEKLSRAFTRHLSDLRQTLRRMRKPIFEKPCGNTPDDIGATVLEHLFCLSLLFSDGRGRWLKNEANIL